MYVWIVDAVGEKAVNGAFVGYGVEDGMWRGVVGVWGYEDGLGEGRRGVNGDGE